MKIYYLAFVLLLWAERSFCGLSAQAYPHTQPINSLLMGSSPAKLAQTRFLSVAVSESLLAGSNTFIPTAHAARSYILTTDRLANHHPFIAKAHAKYLYHEYILNDSTRHDSIRKERVRLSLFKNELHKQLAGYEQKIRQAALIAMKTTTQNRTLPGTQPLNLQQVNQPLTAQQVNTPLLNTPLPTQKPGTDLTAYQLRELELGPIQELLKEPIKPPGDTAALTHLNQVTHTTSAVPAADSLINLLTNAKKMTPESLAKEQARSYAEKYEKELQAKLKAKLADENPGFEELAKTDFTTDFKTADLTNTNLT